MPRNGVPYHPVVTNIFWNTDSWLPDGYEDSDLIFGSMAPALVERGLYGPCVMVYGDAAKFPKEVRDGYYDYEGFGTFQITKGSERERERERERLHLMLVDIVLWASAYKYRRSKFVIISKLSQDSEMICKVLGSLRQRGCHVLFALPEVDVSPGMTVRDKHVLFALPEVDVGTSSKMTVCDEQTSSEMTVCDEQTDRRIPVWICPNLFDLDCPPQPEHGDEKEGYVIVHPAPDPHTINFSMPANVDTCVFWDIEDYPLPPGLQLSKFYENILAAVRSRVPSSGGGALIYAYVVKEEEEFVAPGSGIKVNVVRNAPADKFARLAKITMDFHLWSMDNRPKRRYPPVSRPNLLVITERLEAGNELCLRSTLRGLKLRGHNVFLALPAEKIPPAESYDEDDLPLLSWERLTEIGKLKRGREESDLYFRH